MPLSECDDRADALYLLGLLHFYGVAPSIEKDAARAARLFRDAALKDHTAAMTNFAVLLASGIGACLVSMRAKSHLVCP